MQKVTQAQVGGGGGRGGAGGGGPEPSPPPPQELTVSIRVKAAIRPDIFRIQPPRRAEIDIAVSDRHRGQRTARAFEISSRCTASAKTARQWYGLRPWVTAVLG